MFRREWQSRHMIMKHQVDASRKRSSLIIGPFPHGLLNSAGAPQSTHWRHPNRRFHPQGARTDEPDRGRKDLWIRQRSLASVHAHIASIGRRLHSWFAFKYSPLLALWSSKNSSINTRNSISNPDSSRATNKCCALGR